MDNENILTPAQAWDYLLTYRQAYTARYAAVYSGDRAELRRTAVPRSFWKRPTKQKIHVPIASDIAQVASDMLFGREVQLTCVDTATEDEDAENAKAAQIRLEHIATENVLDALLCEAAESSSAIGDVFLRVSWDKDGQSVPLVRIVQGDDAWPEYRFGVLTCIHFFTVLDESSLLAGEAQIVRACEQYLPDGRILTRVFVGDASNLGREEDPARYGCEPEVQAPVREMLAAHIPNIRPNRHFRGSPRGRSDFDGLRDLMDALDEAYSSWMRDIRLGKARLIVPAEYLRRSRDEIFGGCDNAPPMFEFDEDVETITALDTNPDTAGGSTITPSQPGIRASEHAATCADLMTRIITGAGYAPQTFGLNIEGMAQSGTALHIREKKSFGTTNKKQTYWMSALERLLTSVVHLDAALYAGAGSSPDVHVHVRFSDTSASDISTVSAAVEMLYRAQSASSEIRVAMLHPDWSNKQRAEEVERIREEFGIGLPEPDATLGDFAGIQREEDDV